DTERLAREVWRKVFSEYGLEFTDDCYKEIIGRTIKDAMIILDKAYGHHIPLQELNEKQEALYQDYITRPLPLKPGADELLDWLAQNDIPCALGSSTYHDQVSAILQRNNLSDCFQVLVGGDDVARGKPAPDIFLAAARQLQVAPERCLIIEDSENGLRAANAAGAVTVMVPDLIAPMEIDTTLKFLTFDTLGALIPALEASR
ncbi:MAG: HAD family phosphatase, partial [Actinomycetes bacterium]|nr:HAD family phosphatase [Actinomycetes bacterium]